MAQIVEHPDGVEVWVAVREYEGIYEVSNHGRVRRVGGYGGRGQRPEPSILKDRNVGNGYRGVMLQHCGRDRQTSVHILVAEHFLPPKPSPRHEVAHDDGVKTHNWDSNLVWKTRSQNNLDRRRHGTMPVGEKHPGCKLTDERVREIRASDEYASVLARKYGVSGSLVSKIRSGEARKWVK